MAGIALDSDSARSNEITARVNSCLEAFDALSFALNDKNFDFQDQIQLSAVRDELGRFRIWSGNIGAHKLGSSSLNHRLRDASHIRQRVLSLLEDLSETLQDATDIVRGERIPWDSFVSDSSSSSSSGTRVESDYVGVDAPNRTTAEVQDQTELKQLQSSMIETVTLLLRLSMAIRNPAPHDQFMESKDIDTSHYEEFDIRHVREKFPQAEDYLITRLGRALSRRRHYLRYRDAHHKKLSYGLDSADDIVKEPSGTEMIPQSTIASSLPTTLKAVDHLDLTYDDSSETGFSMTSTASSTNGSSKLRPPPMPEEARDGNPFECPLCFRIVLAHSALSWRKHVYEDLHPYVCTAIDCKTPDRLFHYRHQWFEHERQMHMRLWQCLDGCEEIFQSKALFEDHLRWKHHRPHSLTELTAFIDMHEANVSSSSSVNCPLCRESMILDPQLRRHLGKHQEQLALFVVPPHLNEAEGSEGNVEEDESVANYDCLDDEGAAELIDMHLDEKDDNDEKANEENKDDEDNGDKKGKQRVQYETQNAVGAGLGQEGVRGLLYDSDEFRSHDDWDRVATAVAAGVAAGAAAEPNDKGTRLLERAAPEGFKGKGRGSLESDYVQRPPREDEIYVMGRFANHASHCEYCSHPYKTYEAGGYLCERGHSYAKDVALYVYLKDGVLFSEVEEEIGHHPTQVEIPANLEVVRELLQAFHDGMRKQTPIIMHDKPYYVPKRRAYSPGASYDPDDEEVGPSSHQARKYGRGLGRTRSDHPNKLKGKRRRDERTVIIPPPPQSRSKEYHK